MNLGRYEIETYRVEINGQNVDRQRIIYYANNGIDFFVERYHGEVRDGYTGQNFRFTNLTFDSIKTHILGESIVINDSQLIPLLYISISSIQSIQVESDIRLKILDTQTDPVTLEFISPYDSNQAYSRLNQLLQNPMLDISTLGLDEIPPQIFLNENFYGNSILTTSSGEAGLFTSNDADYFTVTFNKNSFTGPLPLNRLSILNGLVYDVIDNRDDSMSLTEDSVKIYKDVADTSNLVDSINQVGYYVVRLSAIDLSQNEKTLIFSFVIL
jgi:hypothetical protein